MNKENIYLLIDANYKIINSIKKIINNKVLDNLMNNTEANKDLAVLKVNEIILLELKYKIKFNNEYNVLAALKKMNSNLNIEFLSKYNS